MQLSPERTAQLRVEHGLRPLDRHARNVEVAVTWAVLAVTWLSLAGAVMVAGMMLAGVGR